MQHIKRKSRASFKQTKKKKLLF